MKLVKILGVVTLLVLITTTANAKTLKVTATGVGETYDWAVLNAIENAVRQTSNVTVTKKAPTRSEELKTTTINSSSDSASYTGNASYNRKANTGFFGSISNNASVSNNLNEKATANSKNISETSVKNIQKEIDARYEGKIASYEVISSEQKGTDYYVTISATVEKPDDLKQYQSPKLTTKKDYSLAIIPFKSKKNINCLGQRFNSSDLTNNINNELTDIFSSSGKFRMVDRKNFEAYEDEIALITGEKTQYAENNRLKNIVPADYILVGEISDAGASVSRQNIELTGETNETLYANLNVNYRILETATMEIIYSSSVKKSLKKEDSFSKSCAGILGGLAATAAKDMSDKAFKKIFPDYSLPKEDVSVSHKHTPKKVAPQKQVVKLPFDK